MTDQALKIMAADVAPELKKHIDNWLHRSDMVLGSREYRALEGFLWDNKIGLLRFAERCMTLNQEECGTSIKPLIEELVRRTPFTITSTGIRLELSFDQIKRLREVIK